MHNRENCRECFWNRNSKAFVWCAACKKHHDFVKSEHEKKSKICSCGCNCKDEKLKKRYQPLMEAALPQPETRTLREPETRTLRATWYYDTTTPTFVTTNTTITLR